MVTIKKRDDGQVDTEDYYTALKSVQRYLKKQGFLRGKLSGKVKVNPKHTAWRNQYLRQLIANGMLPDGQRKREIYTDESYIHHHHRNESNDLRHPSDENVSEKAPHKDRRYCFVAVIGGEGCNSSAGLIDNSYWSFSSNNKDQNRSDYHKVLIGSIMWNGLSFRYFHICMNDVSLF